MAQEKNFETKIRNVIKKYGGWEVKYFANAFTKKGIPDILACVKGTFIAIEVKADKGKPSELQIHNLKKIDAAGGYAILLYPDDYYLFLDLLIHLVNMEEVDAQVIYYLLQRRWMEYE